MRPTVTLPGIGDAATCRFALEAMLSTGGVTETFIRLVTAVRNSVTYSNTSYASMVASALEHARFTQERRAINFIRAILAIFVTITSPKDGNASVVRSATTMLSFGAISDACFIVRLQNKVVRTGTSVSLRACSNQA